MRSLRRVVPAALAGLLLVICGCGGNGALPYNQTPAISLIVPSNITAGSQTFTLFISGTGFISSNKGVSFGYWNGSARSTNFNLNTGQLEMTVLASDVANPGSAQVSVVNPAPGGGLSAAVTFTIEPPQVNGPVIASISPDTTAVNSKPPLVTISGSNFSINDVVTFDGQYRGSTSTYQSQTQMQIQLATTDVNAAGIGSISVSDPGLVLASPSVNLAITNGNAPSPSIGSLSPKSAASGSFDTQVLVKGSGFVTNSTVLWNSVPVATAYISGSTLMALVPAADLATAGTADVSVMTPAPGGGTSSTSTFTISAP